LNPIKLALAFCAALFLFTSARAQACDPAAVKVREVGRYISIADTPARVVAIPENLPRACQLAVARRLHELAPEAMFEIFDAGPEPELDRYLACMKAGTGRADRPWFFANCTASAADMSAREKWLREHRVFWILARWEKVPWSIVDPASLKIIERLE
jgi:hypothetical protein